MRRFYAEPEHISKDTIHITGIQARHAFVVLRLKAGDKITVFDGKGNRYECVIREIRRGCGIARIIRREKEPPAALELILAQALPKNTAFEEIVDTATQVGVQRIIPMVTGRTVVKIPAEKRALRQKRWQAAAREASKQCRCAYLPLIEEVRNFRDIIKEKPRDLPAVIGACSGNPETLKTFLRRERFNRLMIFIGPEGDFTPGEINLARERGCAAVSLGKNILRCRTAAAAMLTVIRYEWED